MGYELNMLVVDNWMAKKNKPLPMYGYKSILAHVDLCKCGDVFNDILKRSEANTKKYGKKIKELRQKHEEIYNSEGNYTEDMKSLSEREQKRLLNAYYKKEKELQKSLPYVYFQDFNQSEFTDGYGDCLHQATVDEVLEILKKENAKYIAKGETPYRRFVIAEGLLEATKKAFPSAAILFYA
jgi:hypothetical protein